VYKFKSTACSLYFVLTFMYIEYSPVFILSTYLYAYEVLVYSVLSTSCTGIVYSQSLAFVLNTYLCVLCTPCTQNYSNLNIADHRCLLHYLSIVLILLFVPNCHTYSSYNALLVGCIQLAKFHTENEHSQMLYL